MTEKTHPEVDPDETLSPEELTEKYSQEVADFFGLPKEEDITIIIYDSQQELRKELEKVKGYKMPAYTKNASVSFAGRNEIWLTKWGAQDENDKIITRDRFTRSLKHELTHKYELAYSRSKGVDWNSIPTWLKEGVALNVAGQKTRKEAGAVTTLELRHLNYQSDNLYGIANRVVSRIIEQYGKEKLLELMCLMPDKLYEELEKMPEVLN